MVWRSPCCLRGQSSYLERIAIAWEWSPPGWSARERLCLGFQGDCRFRTVNRDTVQLWKRRYKSWQGGSSVPLTLSGVSTVYKPTLLEWSTCLHARFSRNWAQSTGDRNNVKTWLPGFFFFYYHAFSYLVGPNEESVLFSKCPCYVLAITISLSILIYVTYINNYLAGHRILDCKYCP